MELNLLQKVRAAFSAVKYRNELKQLLIRRFWQTKKTLKIDVGGISAIFDTSDFLSNVFFWQSEYPEGYEPSVCELLAKLIKDSKIYADVGGNVGVFSILPAMMNPNCKIYYFEMDKTIRPLLLRNMKINGLNKNRITVVNAAVGDRAGEFRYWPHPYSFLALQAKENINIYDLEFQAPVILLDNYFLEQGVDPDLIKIDIDGAEMSALRGMSRILNDTKPDLLLEVHPEHLPRVGSSAVEVFSYLKGFGYLFFSILDFRHSKLAHLEQIFDFDSISAPTGEMIFVTHPVNTDRRPERS